MQAHRSRTSAPVSATYRLQLNAQFTLHDARARVAYLHDLGISHLYLSPVLAARAGSTHGYDVADPTQVSEVLGGEKALVALAEAVHERNMGIVLDIVPNHMGVGGDNPYWTDLLTHGRRSRYADWFDVEWRAPTKRLHGRVLLPVLGAPLEDVLARGEIAVSVSDSGAAIAYFDDRFPIDPATLPPELEVAMRDPSARASLHGWDAGAEGVERLRALLAAQHYELAHWRTAHRDLNWRRFFDVNELVALRVELEEVFEATHATVLRLVADGVIDGLRVDHIDGLLEPRRYLERLRAAVDARRPAREGERRFPIWVEKILADDEPLPREWPVEGTTGYEIMTAIDDLLIDPAGYELLESRYRALRVGSGFSAVALEAKRRVLRTTLNADVRRLAPMLASLAKGAGWGKLTIAECAGAIVELTTVLPVYRTYMEGEHAPSERDRAVLVSSFAKVRERGHVAEQPLHALERALLGDWASASPELARERRRLVLRWQQLTGPAAAKGVEDTALYRYAPLASRNEVGGDPSVPIRGAAERLHKRLGERAAAWPLALAATNTHDTKRSADVRARLDALSEMAPAWRRAVRRWARRMMPARTKVGSALVPSRATEEWVLQTLVGLWPEEDAPSRALPHAIDAERLRRLRERLQEYMLKALREAKQGTSWTDPDKAFEGAVAGYVEQLTNRERSGEVLREVEQVVEALSPRARRNAMARIAVHLLGPGVPDVYQGDELWYQALVDPDNRRPVEWERRTAMLRSSSDATASSEKMRLMSKLLSWRRANVAILSQTNYSALDVAGSASERCFAFERVAGDRGVLVAVQLAQGAHGSAGHASTPEGDNRSPSRGDDAAPYLRPSLSRWRSLLGDHDLALRDGVLPVDALFTHGPVAILVSP